MSLKFNDQKHPFIELGDGYQLSVHDNGCIHGREFEAKARQAINESPETFDHRLAELRRLVVASQKFHIPIENDWYMKLFLRAGLCDPQKAYDILYDNALQKFKTREYFATVASTRHVYDEGLVWMLPERDDDGSVIIVVESGKKWDLNKASLLEVNTSVNSLITALMQSEEAQLHGCKMIFDVDGLTMSQIMQFTPKTTHILLNLIEKCSPIRVLSTHTMHNTLMYNVLYAIMKPLLTKHMRERMFMHGRDYAGLAKHINPKILPPRFGGTSKAPACDGRVFGDLLEHYDGWMQSLHAYGFKRKGSKAE